MNLYHKDSLNCELGQFLLGWNLGGLIFICARPSSIFFSLHFGLMGDILPHSLQHINLSELPEHVILKSENGSIVILIGTAHISERSASDVRKIIRTVRPTSVLVELCSSRLALIDPERISLIYQERVKLQQQGMSPEDMIEH